MSSSERESLGEASVAPVGWRERRFVVDMWIGMNRRLEFERVFLLFNSSSNVMSVYDFGRWGLGAGRAQR